MQKALIVHSPHAGRSAQLEQAITHLRGHAVEVVDVISVATLDGLSDQGPYWKKQGIDIAVAAGGDGLVGGVITHIAESGLPLGILPLGTSNDVARSLGLPQELYEAARVIANGQFIEVDLGVARPAQQAPHKASAQHGKPVSGQVEKQRHGFFAHALTVGLNVEFARLATNVATRQRYGRFTYPRAAIEVLRNHTALEMELHFLNLAVPPKTGTDQPATLLTEPVTLKCRVLQATVINAPIFGGLWQLAVPRATLHDGLLDIIVIEEVDPEGLNTMLTRFFSRTEQRSEAPLEWHARHPDLHPAELTGIPGIHHVQARGVIMTTTIDPQDATLDGEVRGQTPLLAQMADEKLRVAVPGQPGGDSGARSQSQ